MQLVAGDEGQVHLAIASTDASGEDDAGDDLDRRLLAAITRTGHSLSRSELRAELHVRNERLGQALTRLAATGAIIRSGDRWAVPVPLS